MLTYADVSLLRLERDRCKEENATVRAERDGLASERERQRERLGRQAADLEFARREIHELRQALTACEHELAASADSVERLKDELARGRCDVVSLQVRIRQHTSAYVSIRQQM